MPTFSWIEKALLIALLVASAALCGWELRKVLSAIRRARPTPDFEIRPVWRRAWRFLLEAPGQVKVIRERPLPGLAHAFVLWGFCAFAPITVNHIAAGLGAGFLNRASGFGHLYFGFVAVWAALVAVSITGLFVRRFAVRPVWLGPLSAESGVIAGLIFLLMATYLASFRLEEIGIAGKANWWLHTLALAAFLPLIPRSKHLHLALAPFTVFLKREGFSRIPPLEGDEDFGLDAGKDITRIDALQAHTCVECGRCTEHCPAHLTGKVLNPKEIVLGLRAYLHEFGPRGQGPLLGRHISEEGVFQCTTCGACEFQCPVGIQHLPIIVGLRRGAVNTGRWEDDRGARLFLNLERSGNAFGFASAGRREFVEKNQLPYYDGSQEYCLWLGCMGAFDPHGREIVLALARVLRHLGVSFGVPRQEKCTGDPARRLGNDLAAAQAAEANIAALRAAGVGKMVSICPHCVRAIGTGWREFGGVFEIEHHSQLLARLAERLPVSAGLREKVVFHDPCYLGRYGDVYDEPRAVAARWADVVEPARSRRRSFCCGAGGGRMFLGEEKGRRVHVERAEELARAGARTIATACPFCQSMFRDALGGAPAALLDIAQMAARSLPRG
jgi:Fe-S oxidoreductase